MMAPAKSAAAARHSGHSVSLNREQQLRHTRRQTLGRAVERWMENLEERRLMASVITDQSDYHFDTTAHITGSEFAPLEQVQLQVTHLSGTVGSNDDPQNAPWTVQADASGNFEATWTVNDPDAYDATYVLTATGMTSGLTAQSLFTDGNVKANMSSPISNDSFTLDFIRYDAAGAFLSSGTQTISASGGQGTNVTGSSATFVRLEAAISSDKGGLSGNPLTAFDHWEVKIGGSGSFQRFSGDASRSIFITDFASSTNVYQAVYLVAQGTPQVTTPTMNLSGPEGTSTGFNLGSFTDPDGGPWTVVVNWGDNTTSTFNMPAAGTFPVQNHVYPDNGAYTGTVTVTDSTNRSGANAFIAAITNVAPVVTAPATQSAPKNVSTSFAVGSFTDPGLLDTPWNVSINWGDGSGLTTLTRTTQGALPNQAHTFANSGVFNVVVSVTDKDGGVGTATFQISVGNTAPVATVNLSPSSPKTNDTVTATATKFDADGDAVTLTYVWKVNGVTVKTTANTTSLTDTLDLSLVGNGDKGQTITCQVTPNDGTINGTNVGASVIVANTAPTADNKSVTTLEDTTLNSNVTGADIDGDGLTYVLVTGPAHALSFALNANGSFTYTPALNYNGPDSFTFVVNDGTANSATATVTIDVTPANDAPVAANDSVSTPEDTAKQITLSASDVDTPLANLIYSIVTGPSHGSLTMNSNGVYTYTPNLNYNGPDSFTFKANDGSLDSNVATIAINVTPVNDAPTANAQSVTTDEDTPKVITLTGADIDGDSLSFKITSLPTNGSLYVGSGVGGHLITPADLIGGGYTISGAQVTYLPALDYFGADAFSFVANDATVDSAPAAISINVLDKTGPVITLGGSIGTENDGQTQSFNWNVTDPSGLNSVLVTITKDGSTIFSTTAASGSFNFDAEGLGDFQISVSATDTVGNASNASRSATVIDDDVDGPGIVLGGSVGSENDGQTQSFNWNISDPSGLSAISVVVTKDGVPVYSTSNLADAAGSFNFDSLGLGNFQIDVSATDNDGDRINDTVTATASRSVTVADDDSTGPTIVLGGSSGAENDGQTQSFTWNISDPAGLSAISVVITKDGSTIFSTSDLADAIGSFNFDPYGLGVFQINVSATDADSDRTGDTATSTASRSVTVTDDDTIAPIITLGGSQTNETDGQDQVFTWNVTDAGSGLANVTVTITHGGNTIHTSSAASGSFDFNSYGLGDFQISVTATDVDNDRASDSLSSSASRSVTVTDDDSAAPIIILGGSSGGETDGDTNQFTWDISDAGSGLGAISVVIRKDGDIVYSTTDLADAVGSFTFDSLGLGNFTIEVSATDADADRASDALTSTASRSVTITDDDTDAPVITLGGSQNAETDAQDQVFTWNVTDVSGLSSVVVTITQDGNVIRSSSAASGAFDFNSYGLGVFEISVSATDADADRANDSLSSSASRSVTVTDDDTAAPIIALGGSTGSENDGQLQSFTWNISDAGSGLGSLSVVIRKDGNLIYQTTDLAEAVGSFNFDSQGLGVFTIDVTATDADNDRAGDALTSTASRSATVTDDDVDAPIITLGGSQNSENDGQDQVFTWDVSDVSGLSNITVIITQDGNVIHTSSAAAGSFDFNSYGLGTFEITVGATDADSDRANDSLIGSASRSVVVTDDDTAAPIIVLGGSTGAETDGDTNHFNWNISDAGSGLGSISVVIRKDGSIVYQTSDLADAVGSFNFDTLGLGTYTIDVTATDADADRANDALTGTASRSVVVTDDDTASPVITLGGSQLAETDAQDQIFTWNVSDASGLASVVVTITQDGNVIHSSSAASGSFDFNSYGLGVFEIQVSATDADSDRANDSLSNTASRSVTVSDDDTAAPIITLGGSTGAETDGQPQSFTWNIADAGSGLGSISVIIRKDSAIVYQTTDLADATGTFNFDALGLGTYTIDVQATDADADRADDATTSTASRSVTVTDDDTTPPVITLGGSQNSENDGQNQVFTWNVTDASDLSSIVVTITQDGNLIHTSNAATGSFDFNSYGLGVFEISVSATDADNDRALDNLSSSASRSVTVTDDDIAAPIITLGGSSGAETDGDTNHFTWDISDAGAGLGSISVIIRKDGTVIYQTSDLANAVGSFNFDSEGLGLFTIEVSATDADSDRADDALTSTASRSVTVSDDDTTGPVITLGGSHNSENDGQDQIFTWNVSDISGLSSVSVVITQDGNVIHTSNATSGSFDFNSYGLGVFEITVNATDNDVDRANDALSSVSSRIVTVTDDDTNPPVINLGGSQGAETDGQTNGFSWNVSDADSGLALLNTVITRDDGSGPVVVYSTTSTADAIGSFNFDVLGLGTYQINVSATDADADRANDALISTASRTVVVTDDDTAPPAITLGGSQGVENDGQNQFFTWNVTDAGSGLGTISVVVTKDGSSVFTSSDASGTFGFNTLGLGDYQISVSATDADSDRANDSLSASASRSVTVGDDDVTGPTIVLGGSTGSENDGQAQSFAWNISDVGSGLSAISVIVRQDGNIIYQTSDLANAIGSFDFNSYGLGTFALDVTATDADADRADDALTSTASRSVVVSDDDTLPPTITLGGSQGDETDGQQQVFTWGVNDPSGLSNITVTITKDGNVIHTSSAAGGSFDFDGYGLGVFEISVSATDADADRANDSLTSFATRSVTVTDDDIQAPNIILGGSEGVESDGDTNYFTWDVSDGGSGIGELSVIIRRNGQIIYETHDLANCIGSFNFDSYGLGSYTINVVAVDADGDRSEDSLSSADSRVDVVNDDDVTPPTILLGGSQDNENDGQNQNFTWDISDVSGLGSITVVVTRDGTPIFNSSAPSGTFDFNSFGLGEYQISVSATDADNDRADDALAAFASRSVTVSDDDTTGPTIVLGGSTGSETDAQPQGFIWNISDPSGLSALSVIIRQDGNIVYQTSDLADAVGSFSFDSLGLGTFTIDVSATDGDADRAADTSTATAFRSVNVSDDDTAAPMIVLGGSTGAETDGDANHFTWNISDAGSGLAAISVVITKDGGPIFSTTDLANAVGSFNFDSYGPGSYAISASATDADTDRPIDSLSSNDSRAVLVSDDDTAAPVIDLSGSQGSENDGQNQLFTWNVTDASGLSSVTVIVKKNGSLVQSFTAANGSFDFNSLGLGTYEITVNATDSDTDWTGDQLSNSATRSVTITDDDTAAPVINLGGSGGAETDGDTNAFTWDVSDLGSGLDSFLVTITRNGATIYNTTSVASGSFNFETFGLGDYQISISATDNDHDWAGDELSSSESRSVTVSDDDVTPPTIVLGGSQGSENDGQDQDFTWNVTDVSGLSGVLVTITRNGTSIFTSTSATGSFDFNSFGLGTYAMIVSAADADADRAGDSLSSFDSRTVIVSDDDTANPIINLAGSNFAENDGQTQAFTWDISDVDSGLDSLLVTITRNGTTIYSTTALASGSFNFDSYGLGTYEISVSAADNDHDWVGDQLTSNSTRSVVIGDDDTNPPVINLGGSSGSENDGQDQKFTWNVSDPSGLSNLLVTVSKDGSIIQTFTTASGSFDFNALGLGTYDITVTAADDDNDWSGDISGTSASRTVTVSDDDTAAPTINLGGSTGSETDGDLNHFTWNVGDASNLSALTITITRNGATIFSTSDLAQAAGDFNLDTYGPGNYEISVSATDDDHDWNGDRSSTSTSRSVTIGDDDTASPVIDLSGSQTSENDGQNQFFSWNITDASGLSNVLVSVTRNGVPVFSSINASGTFDFNSYGLGTYEMSVSATDADNDWVGDQLANAASRSVTVSDDDTVAPAIALGGSTGAENDGQNQDFTWNVTDTSGLSSISITVLQNGSPIFTSTNPSDHFDFNSFGPGSYQFVVSATDADNDWTGDELSSSDSRTVVVSDDDTDAPVINLGGSQTSESDGQDQHFTWNVADFSGYDSLTVTVTKNGSAIFTSSAPTGSFDFNSFGLGDYAITVSATDADIDWTGDQLSDSASRSVTVSDDDTTPPTIVLGGSAGSETDGDLNHFTWNVSDASGLSELTITIQRNGVTVFQTADTADAIGSFNFDALGLGSYDISVSATDADQDWTGDTLSSTATRTVVVSDDDVDAPVIVLGGSQGTENDGQDQKFTWSVTDGSGISNLLVTISKGGSVVQTLNSASGSFDFNTLGLGTFDITVSATDADNDRANDSLSAFASRSVTVTDDDVTGPTIVLGGSTGSENDGQPQSFTWNISDAGSGLSSISVIIRQDGNIIYQTSDLANAVGSFNFNNAGLGVFTIDVLATDADSDRAGDALSSTASRSVTVTDDDTGAPSITLGGSSGAQTDGDTNAFTWDVSDVSGLSNVTVTITQDGNVIHTSSAASGSFNFDSYGLGVFEINVSANDADSDRPNDSLSNAQMRSVTVSDDDTAAPVINLGGSQGAENDGQDQSFSWTVTDSGSGLDSVLVTITKDGNVIQSFTSSTGSFDFNTLGLGTFQIGVVASDADSDRANDSLSNSMTRTVIVSDDDTNDPTINLGGSIGAANDGQNQNFNWTVADPSGLSALSVTITRNGSTIFSGNADGSFDFNSFGTGTYVLTVSATDADNDHAGDSLSDTLTRTVVVSDDDTNPPVINLGGSVGSENDGQNQNFTWDVSDASGLAGVSVTIYKDGNVIQAYTAASGSFDFNSLGLGTYQMAVSATDSDTDWAGDQLSNLAGRTVTVSDDDTTGPIIVIAGSTGAENDGQSQGFAWNVTDGGSGLASLNIVVTKDGSTIFSATDLAQAAGSFNFDSYGLGNFQIQINANDNDTDWAGDQLSASASRIVTVSDDDTTPPMIVLGGSQGSETDAQSQSFNWSVTDGSGLASVLVTITQDGNVVQTFTAASGGFDFNSLGLGTFQITVSATDGDNDRADDSLSSTMSRSVTVSDDDTAGPTIVLGGSQGSESHGMTQAFTWNVSDVSGLSSATITVRKDGNVIYSGSAAGGSFTFDSFGLGTFVIEVAATDADNDRANDAMSNLASRQVVVTNANPIAEAGLDQTSNEGSAVNFSGAASSDADGDSLQYFWDFGDGSTGVGIAPVHTYIDNGNYIVSLTVTDGFGGQNTDTMKVKVNNVAPTPNLNAIDNTFEGSQVSMTGDATDPGVNDTETYVWHVVSSNGQTITDATGKNFSFMPNDNGTYVVTFTVTDKDGGSNSATHTVYVSNVAPVAANDGPKAVKQYSDFISPIKLTATDVSSADILTAQIIGGLPANSGLSVNFDPITRTGTLTGKANLAPGTYNVKVRVSDDDGGYSDTTVPVVVSQEDAVVAYSGTTFTATPASSTVATVQLRATVQDITAALPASDPDGGDIRNATVTFVNRDTNTVIASNIPVTLLNAADPLTGVAVYNWTVDIGTALSQSFTIGIIVNNYYTRDSALDNAVVTVSKPLEGFITGGGYFINEHSAGWLSGAVGERTNFGFNVKYTKTGSNLQGNVNIIVHSYYNPDGTLGNTLRVYQIKSNAISWLATQTDTATGKRYASFEAKCNVQDITNPKNVISVAGGLVLDMTLTDAGEPGSSVATFTPDSIGFTIWKGNDLWYSSNWDGTRTIEELLDGGNVQVHTLQGTRK